MNFLFTLFVLGALGWAGPQKKVTRGEDVSVKESFSVAITGMETDTMRVQHLLLKGKSFFMASKLVNGSVYAEKPISDSEFGDVKKTTASLISIPSSDVCSHPITVTVTKGSKTTEKKVCGEKPEVMNVITPFNDKVKSFLEKN
jgi:hypothetical protein